jgi:hypothetical protein
VARREAPAAVRKDRGAIGLRFLARHPFLRVKPGGKHASRSSGGEKLLLASFRRKPESSAPKAQTKDWTPAFAGVTKWLGREFEKADRRSYLYVEN